MVQLMVMKQLSHILLSSAQLRMLVNLTKAPLALAIAHALKMGQALCQLSLMVLLLPQIVRPDRIGLRSVLRVQVGQLAVMAELMLVPALCQTPALVLLLSLAAELNETDDNKSMSGKRHAGRYTMDVFHALGA
jgi:membrane-anchored glycerophosphoryl diester phosphodiesterase (GDPDase)